MLDQELRPADAESAHILIVDDEGAIRYSLSKALQRLGYQVMEASSGEEALAFMDENAFDVVLTDIRMPHGLEGVELLNEIKKRAPDTIVILMTAYASMGSAIEGLRLGAHDYLIKPISNTDIRQSVTRGLERSRDMRRRRVLLDQIQVNVKELTASLATPTREAANGTKAILPPPAPLTAMTIGPLIIFPGRYQIQVGEEKLNLTPTEFDLLVYLAAHRGRVVPCYELVREVRNYAVDEAEAREVIRPHISNLRRKLTKAGQDPDLITNVRGIGYRLTAEGSSEDSNSQ